jgi:predicted RecA/RadA family phage recombinase
MTNTTNLAVPYYEPGSRITGRATTAKVIGKTFVEIAATKDPGSRGLDPDPGGTGGNVRIQPAGAGSTKVFGVAEHDAEVGYTTTVFTDGFVVPITAAVAITAGDRITPAAGGQAGKVATTEPNCGLALADAAVGQDAIVLLRL